MIQRLSEAICWCTRPARHGGNARFSEGPSLRSSRLSFSCFPMCVLYRRPNLLHRTGCLCVCTLSSIQRFPPAGQNQNGSEATSTVAEEDVLKFCFPDKEAIKPLRYTTLHRRMGVRPTPACEIRSRLRAKLVVTEHGSQWGRRGVPVTPKKGGGNAKLHVHPCAAKR